MQTRINVYDKTEKKIVEKNGIQKLNNKKLDRFGKTI